MRILCVAVLILSGAAPCTAQAPRPGGQPAPPPAVRNIVVKAQWLELTRGGNPSVVKRFRIIESPAFVLNNLTPAKARIMTGASEPLQLMGQIRVQRSGVLSLIMYDRADPAKWVYEIAPRDNVRVGDTAVVSGQRTSKDGADIETYVQFTFQEGPQPKKATAQPKAPPAP